MLHKANHRSKRVAQSTWFVLGLSSLLMPDNTVTVSYSRNFTLKHLLLLSMVQKFLFFTISHIRHLLMLPLTCVALKMVSTLVADFYVVNNPELFMLFGTRSYIFCAASTGARVIFNWLGTSGFKTEASFHENALWGLEKNF